VETHERVMIPSLTSDGAPIVPMTEEQKYVFDLKGWLLLPGLLADDELEPIRSHVRTFLTDPEALPPDERHFLGGPAQVLLDHPVVMGVLEELLSHVPVATEDVYGLRYDHGYATIRTPDLPNPWGPHGGSGIHALVGNSHIYQAQWGRVFSGLTRVVWELNPVHESDGATLLLSGSHKVSFDPPEAVIAPDSPLWERYSCPAGSVLIFTEALCHTGQLWRNAERDRLALFTCYNALCSAWAKHGVPPEVIETMPLKRQSLFRGVWTGMDAPPKLNVYVDAANRAV
jgi:hypothetical protein